MHDKGLKKWIRRIPSACYMLLLLVVFFTLQVPDFLSPENMAIILRQAAPLLVLASGQTLIILLQGTDLSLGSIVSMAGVLWMLLLNLGVPMVPAVLCVLAASLMGGVLNGFLVARGRLPVFIVTLGTQNIFKSAALLLCGSQTLYYRDSIFKHELKGRYIVTSVVYKVKPGDATKTREEIIQTRMAKLPTVGEVGSAGSFFMNPFVSEEKANELLAQYPDMPNFPSPQGVKIPAAWLIEQCGWKGKTLGGAQVWPKQPLVIVNANHATPDDIIALAAQVSASVKEKFGIDIHPEVNYI